MEKHICKTCENEFSGNYCNNCGEKVIRKEDRKFNRFIGEFINAVTFADSKFWSTLKLIFLKPGRYSKEFSEGKRRNYMKPISVFFFANLVYFLFPLTDIFNTTLNYQLNGQFVHSPLASKMINKRIESRDIGLEEYRVKYDSKTKELSKLLLIFMSILLSLFLWLIHYKNTQFLSDHLTVSLEIMIILILFIGQLFTGILILFHRLFLDFLISELELSIVTIFLLLIVMIGIERNFYQTKKIGLLLKGLLNTIAFVITLFAYRALLFFVTFLVT